MSLIVVSILFRFSYGAPVQTVHFMPENGGPRGTLSLILSCVLTLTLCVYTAVHLNVPPRKEKKWRTRLRELKWCVVGLFGPELVLFYAWRQWSSANALGHELRGLLEVKDIEKVDYGRRMSNKGRENKWTMVQGFYASMGGFVIEPNWMLEDHEADLFGGYKRLTLTPRGVLLLAKCGYLPDISKDEIEDKSKADKLAKIVVCLQAGWMFVQVISRLADDLPVTLLEVNTLGHVACAFVMYLLWWDKPRQVEEPTIMEGDWIKDLGAFMFISSRISGRKGEQRQFVGSIKSPPDTICRPHCPIHATNNSESMSEEDDTVEKDPKPTIARQLSSCSGAEEPCPERVYTIIAKDDEERHIQRFQYAGQAIAKYKAVRERFEPRIPGDSDFIALGDTFLVSRASNWPTDGLLRNVHGLLMGTILWFGTIVYGAIHTAAWRSYFPTVAEKWLWHSSSIWVAISGVIWLLVNLIAKLYPPIDEFWIAFQKRKTHWGWDWLFGPLCAVCGLMYIFARAYLVIEAFISIRQLPVTAYNQPGWVQAIPHL